MNVILSILPTLVTIALISRFRALSESTQSPNLMPSEPRPLTDREFKLLAHEVCEQLAAGGKFKSQVTWKVCLSLIGVFSVVATLIGWSLSTQIHNFKNQASQLILVAKDKVEAEIKNKLQTDEITRIINKSANDQAKAIIDNSLNPSLNEFRAKIDKSSLDLDAKIHETSKTADENLYKLENQLKILSNRNQITALADTAISNGSFDAYLKLEALAKSEDSVVRTAAIAELVKVFQAYGPFAPSRIDSIKINAALLDPEKKDEKDLIPEDIIPKWSEVSDGLGRAKLAYLMESKVKQGSYKTAEFLISAIRKETHLESLKHLGIAFSRTAGVDLPGKLDQRQMLDWWKQHEMEFKKTDTDR